MCPDRDDTGQTFRIRTVHAAMYDGVIKSFFTVGAGMPAPVIHVRGTNEVKIGHAHYHRNAFANAGPDGAGRNVIIEIQEISNIRRLLFDDPGDRLKGKVIINRAAKKSPFLCPAGMLMQDLRGLPRNHRLDKIALVGRRQRILIIHAERDRLYPPAPDSFHDGNKIPFRASGHEVIFIHNQDLFHDL